MAACFDYLIVYAGSDGINVSGAAPGLTFAVTPASPDDIGASRVKADNGAAVSIFNATIDLRLGALISTTTVSSGVPSIPLAASSARQSEARSLSRAVLAPASPST